MIHVLRHISHPAALAVKSIRRVTDAKILLQSGGFVVLSDDKSLMDKLRSLPEVKEVHFSSEKFSTPSTEGNMPS